MVRVSHLQPGQTTQASRCNDGMLREEHFEGVKTFQAGYRQQE